MSWIDGLRHRLNALVRPAAHERELQDEMRHHLELDAMQQRDPTRARRRFGNRTYYQEEVRRLTWLSSLDVLRQDFGYAWRSIRRSPGFTVMVVVTLALGLGVNAATFSVLDRVFLRAPSGVQDPEGLQRDWFETSAARSSTGKAHFGIVANYPMVRATVASSTAPASFASYHTDFSLFLRRDGVKTRVRGVFTSASYFSVLGVTPIRGRVYTAAEDSMGHAERVVVLSHRFWQRTLGGDESVLGRVLNIEYEDYRIIGVLPAGFDGLDLQAVDVWIPNAALPAAHWVHQGRARWWEGRNTWSFQMIRRPDPDDAGFEQRATLALRELNRRLWEINPDTLMNVRTDAFVRGRLGEPGQDMILSSRLAGVAAIVLLIACANVINLLLARAVRRRREIAVRLALGISRWRLVRLLTSETVLLALIAGAVALIGAWWGGTLLRSLLLPQVEWYESVLHWRVMLFALGVTLLAGIIAGVIPALQSSAPGLTSALKEGARDGADHRSRLRQGLIVVQAAFSVVLLIGAALFLRSLGNVKALDIGYDADRIAFGLVEFEKGQQVPAAVVAATLRDMQSRLAQRPGVEAVARSTNIPMQGISFITFYWGPGGVDSSRSLQRSTPTFSAVSPEFFRAMGMRMVAGATFDAAGTARDVVVNEATAALLWPGTSALGQCMRFEKRENPCYTVVGVVSNARQSRVIEDVSPQFYLPIDNMPITGWYGVTLIVRADENALSAAQAEIASALRRAFPTGQTSTKAMLADLEPEYRPWRLAASLFSGFGLLALVVAMVGVYSAVSYGVTQRRHEFGVRIALGAQVRDVLRLVVSGGVRVVAVGVVVGAALAMAAGNLVSALLYGVRPHDPVAMLVAGGALLMVAALAALVPAWRASRVDPVVALRAD
jgi:putative ABC transport system permease protein